MALTNTTLSSACSATDLLLNVTSTSSGFPGIGIQGTRQVVRVGGEFMLLDFVVKSGVIKVLQRGWDATPVVAHDTLETVSTSADPQDFGNPPPTFSSTERPPYTDDVVTIGSDLTFTAAGTPQTSTTIPIPTRDTTYLINKGSAAGITLISATGAQMGVRLRFFSISAFAHTVTYTPGFQGDTTASDVATSAAKVGACFETICGPTGLWGSINAFGSVSNWTLG